MRSVNGIIPFIFLVIISLFLSDPVHGEQKQSEDPNGTLDVLPDSLTYSYHEQPVLINIPVNGNSGENKTYCIDWGDGTQTGSTDGGWSHRRAYAHTYSKTGLYTLNIKEKNASGEIETRKIEIRILSGHFPGPEPNYRDLFFPLTSICWFFIFLLLFLFILGVLNFALLQAGKKKMKIDPEESNLNQ